MELITLCLPTRGRPRRFARTVASARSLAAGALEVVAWVDEDDERLPDYPTQEGEGLRFLTGPREIQSNLWNRCWAEARGDLGMLCADDAVFKTPKWDLVVRKGFERFPDRLAVVYGNDGSPWHEATFPFLSREWVDAVGTFTPPYFRSWFADRWVWELAERTERLLFLPRLRIAHEHPSRHRNIAKDQTYLDGERFREEDHPKERYLTDPELIAEWCEQLQRLVRAINAARRPAASRAKEAIGVRG